MLNRLGEFARGVAVCGVCGVLFCLTASGQEVKQYKGNLHTHSLWSDGDDYPEMIARWYRDNGYQFLTFTDHNTLQVRDRWTDVLKNKGGKAAYDRLKATFPDQTEERQQDGRLQVRLQRFEETRERFDKDGEFMLLHGEEISDAFGNKPLHLNVSNIKELIPRMGGDSVFAVLQNNVNAANSQRERTGQPMMIHVNHPNFGWAVTERDLARLVGERFFEVYNGHPSVKNEGDDSRPGTERMWDVVLAYRLGVLKLPLMYGIAVDDGHNYHKFETRKSNPGRGWVIVWAEELSPGAIIRSMEAGRFYGSSGVALKSVKATNQKLSVEVVPEKDVTYTVEFFGTRKADLPTRDALKGTDRHWSPNIGQRLATVQIERGAASYDFKGDEVYVRARVTSTKKHPNPGTAGEVQRAWVQPVAGPAALPAD